MTQQTRVKNTFHYHFTLWCFFKVSNRAYASPSPLLPHGNLPRRAVQLPIHPLLDLRPVGCQIGVLQDHRVLPLRPPSTPHVHSIYISLPPRARTTLGFVPALLIRPLAGRCGFLLQFLLRCGCWRWCRLERLLQFLQLFVRRRRGRRGRVEVEGGAGGRQRHALRLRRLLQLLQRVLHGLLRALQPAARGLRGGDDLPTGEPRARAPLHRRRAHHGREDAVDHAAQVLRLSVPPRTHMLQHGLAAGVHLQLVDQLAQKLLALPHALLLRLTAMPFDYGDRVLSV